MSCRRIALGAVVVAALLIAGATILFTSLVPFGTQESVRVGPVTGASGEPSPSGDASAPTSATPLSDVSPSVVPATPAPSAAPTTPAGPPVASLSVVASGFASPLGVVAIPDGTGRVLVLEQGGAARAVRDGRVDAEPFLEISALVSSGGERGLLGLAFHPRYPADPRLFVNYTDRDGTTVVASYRVASDGDRADPASAETLLRIEQPYANHNGGHLAFGPDGYLYIGTGDGGFAGDPGGNGQNVRTLLGKMLRIDVDRRTTGAGYAIPADNPFAAGGGAPEVWAYGLRNPWRYDFDPATGDLWIGDVGQNAREEVDVIRAGTPSPVDLGWNVTEGDLCYRPATGCDATGILLPVATYGHDAGCSVTGGVVARGEEAGSLEGRYVYADYCTGTIRWLDAAEPGRGGGVLLETGRQIASFGRDPSGGILLVDLGRGELLRLGG